MFVKDYSPIQLYIKKRKFMFQGLFTLLRNKGTSGDSIRFKDVVFHQNNNDITSN